MHSCPVSEFMPNYESMMEKSMSGGGNGSSSSSSMPASGSSYSNFSSVNDMLKGFMELQKEQLKMERAKAEANKAKVDLAMDYDDDDEMAGVIDAVHARKKRTTAQSVRPHIDSRKDRSLGQCPRREKGSSNTLSRLTLIVKFWVASFQFMASSWQSRCSSCASPRRLEPPCLAERL